MLRGTRRTRTCRQRKRHCNGDIGATGVLLENRAHDNGAVMRTCLLAVLMATLACANAPAQPAANRNGWIPLFNGRDLDGWIPKISKHDVGENYAHTFRVVDGMLQVRYD